MDVEIINQPLTLDVFGFSGTAVNTDYAGTALKLMDNISVTFPYVEIYGHWTSDENLLETELLMAIT